ncbi:hypothetical protein BZK31_11720 [Pseudomonas floridensis]|uniref:Uncharacterized protein n=1 Tax=Pseudomonas floridensis TaxID=1958950 RepID=A0A1X0N6Q6_9PSED|nr:hypothetical protein [Pseudomonas floridensis]ORC59189.1 hypothetical protein BZK31_11720 [Pseudomonas floridensis]
MSDIEILSLSPDGRYQVQAIPWEAGNTHWLFPPQIIDTQNGNMVFGFEDLRWSADFGTWLSPTRVELKLRKHPGLRAPLGLTVIIECALRTAELGDGTQIELACLESTLEGMIELLG